jgi:hypothetical protein
MPDRPFAAVLDELTRLVVEIDLFDAQLQSSGKRVRRVTRE